MNSAIVVSLVLSLLGFTYAASIPSDVESLPINDELLAIELPKEVEVPSFGRIVGGSAVDISEYPYQVGLLFASSQICGGSIIGQNWILTAAHCITGSAVSQYSIRAGSNFRSSGGVTRASSNIYIHARYSASTIDNDIAIVQLASALTYGSTINRITLPAAGTSIPSGTNAITTGWGTTAEGGSSSNQLLGVTVPVVTNAVCRGSYGTASITDNMLCAGLAAGGRDACQGDSGGPLVASAYGQIGIVSWGSGCARPGFYGVYASVPALRAWITTVSGI